jgi:uncharacterized protein (DUF488 family)
VNVFLCPTCYAVIPESGVDRAAHDMHVADWVTACGHYLSGYKEIAPEQAETAMLYTVGYAYHKPPMTPETFLEALHAQQIAFLVDVRRMPLSHKPGFSKTPLSAFLEANSIGYWHCTALGVPKERRRELQTTGDYGLYFYDFLGYLRSAHYAQAALRSVAALVADRQHVALLCTEANAEECHRHVVAEEVHRLLAGKPGLKHL